MNKQQKYPIAVMMVPFPEQSHLNQLLRLSCLISSHNIPVHFIASSTHNRQVKLRSNGINQSDIESLHFHDVPISIGSAIPNPNSTSKFPTHLVPVFEACLHLRQPFKEILHNVSATAERVVVIHDSCMASIVQDAASLPNTEIYTYWAVSAFFLLYMNPENLKPFQSEIQLPEIPPSADSIPEEVIKFVTEQDQFLNNRTGDLINTSRLIESTYVDLIQKVRGDKKQWPIAPLFSVTKQENPIKKDKSLDWLDKQEPNSVIYVSFGTTTSLKKEQIVELAMGLEQSKVKFIWVLRDADKGDIFTSKRRLELPEGFEKRNEEMGLIVRDWAPQLDILGHPSVGGFMSHCGWTSCLESMSMGVPIAAWPMHSEQPQNAVLACDVLKMGVVVKRWTHMEEVVEASYVTEAVRKLMVSEEGHEMRKRARSLGDSFGGEGACGIELESFLTHITR